MDDLVSGQDHGKCRMRMGTRTRERPLLWGFCLHSLQTLNWKGDWAHTCSMPTSWVRRVHLQWRWASGTQLCNSSCGVPVPPVHSYRGYEGEFVEDRKQGQGSFFFENGDAYEVRSSSQADLKLLDISGWSDTYIYIYILYVHNFHW